MSSPADDDYREAPALPRFLFRAALGLAPRVPPRARNAIAFLLALLEYRIRPSRRAAVLENLRQIGLAGHPGLTRRSDRERAARSVFRSYHRFFIEFLAQRGLDGVGFNRTFRFAGMDVLYDAVALGRGAIVAAPHLGNWELSGLALARLGFQVHVVTGTQLHPALHDAVRALKEEAGIAVSTPEDGFVPLLETLKRGGLVVLLVDGDVYTRGVRAPFFGQSVPFPAGPALLARRSGAPLLHAHSARSGDHHRISFDGADAPDRGLSLDQDLARLTGRMAAAQERNIAAHVAQWCIFRPFFGTIVGDARAGAASGDAA